jgi:hypothetical protein
MEQLISSLSDLDHGRNWKRECWPVKSFPYIIESQIALDWVYDHLLNPSTVRALKWEEAKSIFRSRFENPYHKSMAEQEFRKFTQGNLHIDEFAAQFQELAVRVGYDLSDRKIDEILCGDFLAKIKQDLRIAWMDWPRGLLSNAWLNLTEDRLNYMIREMQAIVAHEVAKGNKQFGTSQGGGGEKSEKSEKPKLKPGDGDSDLCRFHPRANHTNKECFTTAKLQQLRQSTLGFPVVKSAMKASSTYEDSSQKPQVSFSASTDLQKSVCRHCGRNNHPETRCYTQHPELREQDRLRRQQQMPYKSNPTGQSHQQGFM